MSDAAAPRASDEFRVNNFDLLRILAAFQVVVAHAVAHLSITRPSLWKLFDAFPGVPIFFAISGFLISASFERTPNLASYARNRVLRIYPALWCVVLLTVPVAIAFGYSFLRPEALVWLGAQLAGVIYTPQFLDDFGFGSYNGALWTIPIELQFYVLLPALYFLGKRLRRLDLVLLTAWIMFTVVAYLFARSSPPLAENVAESIGHKLFRYSFAPHVFLFLSGILLQRIHAQRSRWIAGKGLFWMAAYLVVHFGFPGEALHYAAGSLVMAVMTVSLAYTARDLSQKLLRGNDLSYGVYIYHGLVINALIEIGLSGRVWHLVAVLVATTVLAFLSWRLVERPFLRLKRKSLHAIAPATPAPASAVRR